MKKKNDQLEAEIERSRKNKNGSDDFTLVGTSKSGSIQAGLNSVSNINDLPAPKLMYDWAVCLKFISLVKCQNSF